MMQILVFNSGSSSLKFQLYTIDHAAVVSVLEGAVRGLGGEANCEWRYGGQQQHRAITARDHAAAARHVLDMLEDQIDPSHSLLNDVTAIGHRIVHGGDLFTDSVLLTEQALRKLDAVSALAPLHNPPALAVVDACRARLPLHPQVGVFDTAYFQELPDYVHRYALPAEWRTSACAMRRYGFHGLAHRSMAERYFALSGSDPETSRLITLQLGHGCSIAAIRAGYPLETSMGFTPLEGLIMATRPGDLDVGVVLHLLAQGIPASDLNEALNQRAGLLGLSGVTGDMQQLLALEAEGHRGAALALQAFVHRARKYLGAYLAVLGGADAIIFGGGIGEHSPEIRARICAGMAWCGIALDAETNRHAVGKEAKISASGSSAEIHVLPVNEELLIAQETLRCVQTATD
ncbi:MAG TPA: acetate/propionate family kinase [Gammaproteobacteria bacterium]